MKLNETPRLRLKSILGSLVVLTLFFCSAYSNAQSPVNFSGVWIQDTTKSDDFYKKYNVKYTIAQTLQTFSVKQSFSDKNGKEIISRDYSFTLDGKVKNMQKDGKIEKEVAQWSDDKKILTTRSTRAYGKEDVGFTATYSLSDNGLVLTVLNANIIPEALSVKQVFNRKK
jgi:hypothetical protein